jgi:hypothetical protein
VWFFLNTLIKKENIRLVPKSLASLSTSSANFCFMSNNPGRTFRQRWKLIKSYLFTSAFKMSQSKTNLLKFEWGISNDLASLLYLPLVSRDNHFICHSLARQMPWQWNDTSALSSQQYNIIFYWLLAFVFNNICYSRSSWTQFF